MLPIYVIGSGKTCQHESFGDINTSALILERQAKLLAAGLDDYGRFVGVKAEGHQGKKVNLHVPVN